VALVDEAAGDGGVGVDAAVAEEGPVLAGGFDEGGVEATGALMVERFGRSWWYWIGGRSFGCGAEAPSLRTTDFVGAGRGRTGNDAMRGSLHCALRASVEMTALWGGGGRSRTGNGGMRGSLRCALRASVEMTAFGRVWAMRGFRCRA
jgi:hypothetical protein